MKWVQWDPGNSADLKQTVLMGKSLHEPDSEAREDHCGLIKGNWFTTAFANVIIRFIVLLRLENCRNKKDSIRVLLNSINRNNEQHHTRNDETKTKKLCVQEGRQDIRTWRPTHIFSSATCLSCRVQTVTAHVILDVCVAGNYCKIWRLQLHICPWSNTDSGFEISFYMVASQVAVI